MYISAIASIGQAGMLAVNSWNGLGRSTAEQSQLHNVEDLIIYYYY